MTRDRIARRRPHTGDSGLLYADEVLGRRWTALIIACLSYGPLRFSEIEDELGSISARTLTSRLRELEQIDLIDRTRIAGRVEYELTRHGRRLIPVIDEMRRLTPGPLPSHA